MLGTKVMLKQWKDEAAMLSCGHHGVVRGSGSVTKVSVAVMPFQSELCVCHCTICITGEVAKDSKCIII